MFGYPTDSGLRQGDRHDGAHRGARSRPPVAQPALRPETGAARRVGGARSIASKLRLRSQRRRDQAQSRGAAHHR